MTHAQAQGGELVVGKRPPHVEPRIDVLPAQCKRGHAMTEENTYWRRNGSGVCRICKAASTYLSNRRRSNMRAFLRLERAVA